MMHLVSVRPSGAGLGPVFSLWTFLGRLKGPRNKYWFLGFLTWAPGGPEDPGGRRGPSLGLPGACGGLPEASGCGPGAACEWTNRRSKNVRASGPGVPGNRPKQNDSAYLLQ